MNTDDIIRLIDKLNTSKLNFLEYSTKEFSIKLGTEGFVAQEKAIKEQESVSSIPNTPVDFAMPTIADEKVVAMESEKKEVKTGYEVKSPIVGIFYEAASPGKPPIVSVGDRVKKGDTLCIIEAMKVMNEIVAEVDGIIISVNVNNGELVEYNQVLFNIKEN